MTLERFLASMEVKQVDGLQRIISGYAAVIGNIDLGNDVIEPGAFTKTLRKKQPAEIGVFIGHDTSSLPVGIPIVLRVDAKGLYSETLVKPGPAGDDLLATAQFMAAHGRPLGQSIGYRIAPGGAKMDRLNGKTVRRLVEIDLHEYSFAAGMAVMNPEALTTGVKTGGSMQYTVKEMGGRFHVMKGEGDKALSLADFASQEEAEARCNDLNSGGGKTVHPNQLPDSAFLYVQAGGQVDDEGKTVPRSYRHFAYRDADGALDFAALRAALPAIPEAKTLGLESDELMRLAARGRHILDQHERGVKTVEDDQSAVALDLRAAAYRLLDAADRVVTEHKALAVIGESTNEGRRMRPDMRAMVSESSAELARIVERAEMIERGAEGKALSDWWSAQFDFAEVTP